MPCIEQEKYATDAMHRLHPDERMRGQAALYGKLLNWNESPQPCASRSVSSSPPCPSLSALLLKPKTPLHQTRRIASGAHLGPRTRLRRFASPLCCISGIPFP